MFSFSQFGAWYNDSLDLHPLLTKAITTAAIGLLGDALAQFHEQRVRANHRAARPAPGRARFAYDTRRGFANLANNLILTAPIYHYGFDWLEGLIPILSDDHDSSPSIMGNSLAALRQVLVDCVLFDALFVLLLFLSAGVIEGNDNNLNMISIRTSLLPAIAASWKVNLVTFPVEFVLFRYFPQRLRVLGMNLIDLVWEAVMSYVVHDDGAIVRPIRRDNSGVVDSEVSTGSTPSTSSTSVAAPWSAPAFGELIVDDNDLNPTALAPATAPAGDAKQKQS